jgi:hypothetical protein
LGLGGVKSGVFSFGMFISSSGTIFFIPDFFGSSTFSFIGISLFFSELTVVFMHRLLYQKKCQGQSIIQFIK